MAANLQCVPWKATKDLSEEQAGQINRLGRPPDWDFAVVYADVGGVLKVSSTSWPDE